MLKMPTVRQLDAMIKIKNDESFGEFLLYLNEIYLSLAVRSTKIQTEPQGKWMQGGAQVLEELIKLINTASDIYENLKMANQGE
jgi:hypothetical protein